MTFLWSFISDVYFVCCKKCCLCDLLDCVLQASVPAEALLSFWTDGYRKSWGVKLYSASSAEEVLQVAFHVFFCYLCLLYNSSGGVWKGLEKIPFYNKTKGKRGPN